MAWRLLYYTEVETDLRIAKKWYKDQQAGLEKRFTDEVRKGLDRLQNDPLLYEIRYKDIRIKHLDIFPYGIHFQTNPALKTVTVIAILHHHQNPEIYYNR